eukprot:CAMPEP_0194568626 /NCGR_PEP_ID=MMETSP0292-20121207/6679_1 /TAXON_ID=39354 /ORGANISM="Heterosigma akashiwo, Strain CCMP2393" /LENGTH=148 /DNA_ID=CAMNT_0039418739 /DNA_START=210 /DNA_END=656 /DNA_ORIENTATION=-
MNAIKRPSSRSVEGSFTSERSLSLSFSDESPGKDASESFSLGSDSKSGSRERLASSNRRAFSFDESFPYTASKVNEPTDHSTANSKNIGIPQCQSPLSTAIKDLAKTSLQGDERPTKKVVLCMQTDKTYKIGPLYPDTKQHERSYRLK